MIIICGKQQMCVCGPPIAWAVFVGSPYTVISLLLQIGGTVLGLVQLLLGLIKGECMPLYITYQGAGEKEKYVYKYRWVDNIW